MKRNCLLIILGLNFICVNLHAQILYLTGNSLDNECSQFPNGFCEVFVAGGTPPFTYQWSNGVIHSSFDNIDTISELPGGNYYVTVTDNNGSTATTSIWVPQLLSLDFAPVAAALPRPGTSTGVIQASTFGNSIPGPVSMMLHSNTTSQTWGPFSFACNQLTALGICWGIHCNFDHLPAGDYVCTLSNSNGCTGTFSVLLPELTAPVYSLTLSTSPACPGGANGTLTMHFKWLNSIPGTINYTNSAFGGPGQVTVKESLQYYLYNNAGTLIGNKYNLNDSVFTGLSPGNYKLHVVYLFDYPDNPVELSRDTFAVTIPYTANPTPVITANGPVTFCPGGSVLLSTPNSTGGSFQWKKNGTPINGATSNSYTASSTGTYKVQKTNQYGCSGSSSGTAVSVLSLPTATATPQGPTTFCSGDSVLLKANYNAAFSYQWKKNNGNIAGAVFHKYNAKTAGNYKVKVTHANGCTNISNTVTVSVPCREESQTGIPGMEVKVNPNPSHDLFNLTVNNSTGEILTISVYDMTGRLMKDVVQQLSPAEFTIIGLLNGIYMAEVKQGTQKKIIRLVKAD